MSLDFSKLLVASIIVASMAGAEPCQSLAPSDRPQLETFVKRWYRLPDGQTVTLTDSSTTDAACYRKLVFRASVAAPPLVLYLTPDKTHLVSSVMDLNIDPAISRRKIQQELAGKLESGGWLTSGDEHAATTLVVFSDFQCPYCKRFADIMHDLAPEERARLRIIYRQLPLNIHSWALDAAELTTCVALQDKTAFWSAHEFLFANQQQLSKENVLSKTLDFLAHEKNIDTGKINTCLANQTYQENLSRDEALAGGLGITITPTVFLNGRRANIRSIEDLRTAIKDSQLQRGTVAVQSDTK
jgi:protein-disulfide isomerase